jgi:uncharacterized protein (TIGR02466 family)
MEILPLFPTPVGLFKLDEPVTKSELKYLSSLSLHNNLGNETSDNKYLTKESKIKRLTKFFEESVDAYFKDVYAPRYDVKLKITQCWLNSTKTNQHHHLHSHPNSFVSGVYFVQSDDTTGKIFFHKDIKKVLDVSPKEYNVFNSESWWLSSTEGTLLLFPSTLSHSVERVESEKTRLSISFNTFPVGYLGEEGNLTAMHL